MGTNNTTAVKREKIFIPMAVGREDPTLEVMINGKRYRLPKGTEQEVPAEVAAEIKRSWAAARAFEKTRRQKLEEAEKAASAIK